MFYKEVIDDFFFLKVGVFDVYLELRVYECEEVCYYSYLIRSVCWFE